MIKTLQIQAQVPQINEIKNSSVKQNEILKQALNLNKELDYKN